MAEEPAEVRQAELSAASTALGKQLLALGLGHHAVPTAASPSSPSCKILPQGRRRNVDNKSYAVLESRMKYLEEKSWPRFFFLSKLN